MTVPWRPVARPLPNMVAREQGEMDPTWKPAALVKPPAVTTGPIGTTVRVNAWVSAPTVAVMTTARGYRRR